MGLKWIYTYLNLNSKGLFYGLWVNLISSLFIVYFW